MIDAHVHLEKGDYTVKRNIDEIFCLIPDLIDSMAITRNDVKQICDKLIMENTDIPNDNPEEDLSEDIFQIVFRRDKYECGDTAIIDRYIDIEYSFGEYYEVSEGTSLFQYICSLCNLSLSQEDREEIIIYQQSQRGKPICYRE